MSDLTRYFGGQPLTSQSTETTNESPHNQLLSAMRQAGFDPPERLILDGKIHRFRAGKKRGDDSGWYVAFDDDFPAGSFGSWKTGEKHDWKAHVNRVLSPADELAIMRRREEIRELREEEQRRTAASVASVAKSIWDAAPFVDDSDSHPYLARKQIRPHGAKVTGDGRLILPLYSEAGALATLQYIKPDGSKRYHLSGSTTGKFWCIGDLTEATQIYLAEGYATAATVHEHTEQPCLVAFTASNLPSVAESARKLLPNLPLTIVVDNDAGGVGLSYASQAASKTGARYVMPPKDDPQSSVDANDFALAGGDLRALLSPPKSGWLIQADDFAKQPAPIKWLIKRWLQANSLIMLHGPSGSGKTFAVVDWCCHIASNKTEWAAQKVTHGSVVYLAGEGHHGLRSRLAAWKQVHQPTERLRMWISSSGCDIDQAEGYCKARDAVRELTTSPDLIVIDTVHRFMTGDENSSQEVGKLIKACGALMAEFGCSVMLVHHTGVSDEAQARARGSSAWRGALENEINIKPAKGDDPMQIRAMKCKDSDQPDPLCAELSPVEIDGWFDEDGDPVSSVVLSIVSAPVAAPKSPDKVVAQNQSYFSRAWFASGCERSALNADNSQPYLSRSALTHWLEKDAMFSARSIATALDENSPKSLVGSLIAGRHIESIAHGWRARGQFADDLTLAAGAPND